MLSVPTTLVVGAGASAEYKLPLGSELRSQIASLINIGFSDFGRDLETGDHIIVEALRVASQTVGFQGNINAYIPSARSIAAAMPLALSIDNYLEAHADNEPLVLCGKLAIVRAILAAEEASPLRWDPRHSDTFSFEPVKDTWLARLMQLITEGVSKSEIESVFDRLTIISFNYDRCIKHFVREALKHYYILNDDEANVISRKLRVFHPYGSVGTLPWENGRGVTFGQQLRGQSLYEMSGRIKTFSEQMDDDELLNEIRKATNTAEQIIFIGYAYHPQNMKLIEEFEPKSVSRIIGTSLGVSASDTKVVQNILRGSFSSAHRSPEVLLYGGTATQLFDEYRRTIIA